MARRPSEPEQLSNAGENSSPSGSRPLRLLVAVSVRHGYQRETISGINRYCHEHPRWKLLHDVDTEPSAELIDRLRGKFDAVIAESYDSRLKSRLESLKVPVVLVNRPLDTRLAFCCVSIERVTDLAAEYFRGKGFEDFSGFHFRFHDRIEMFRRSVESLGGRFHPAAGFEDIPDSWEDILGHVETWLANLPRPAAILAANIRSARYLVACAQELGARVPDDLAVIALGQDPLVCQLSDPTITSIDLNNRRVGYQAAAMAHELLLGRDLDSREVFVSPAGVIERGSTDIFAVDDPATRLALRYIRQNAHLGAQVPDVVEEACVSRSKLERTFRRYLGRSIHQQLTRAKLDEARRLLLQTDLPIIDIAHRSGFGHRSRLHEQFRRHLRQSPHQYRLSHR
jgi:LacI family transcriptional regulator